MYFIFLFSLNKGAWTGLEYEYAQLCLNQSMVSTALSGIDSHFVLCLRVCLFIRCLLSGCLILHRSYLLLFKILLFTLHLFWFSFDRHPWKVWRHSTQSLERNWVWRPLCSPNGSFYLFWVRLRSGKEYFAISSSYLWYWHPGILGFS